MLISFYVHARPQTPTRFPYTTLFRSSEKEGGGAGQAEDRLQCDGHLTSLGCVGVRERGDEPVAGVGSGHQQDAAEESIGRSEEHTSELQSPCNLVCRLLLEKKNPQLP